MTPRNVDVTKKVIVAYIPVLHQGYRSFIENNPGYHDLYVVGDSILDSDRSIVKDIRRLKPHIVRQSLTAWNLLNAIIVADAKMLETLNAADTTILMPDEDISRSIAKNYFPMATIEYVSVFLRWDRTSSNAKDPVLTDMTISHDRFHKTFFDIAERESEKSSDIWRRVGAAVSRNGKLVGKSHNQATPTVHSSWMYGDPRNSYSKGADIDKTVFIHAEAKLIAEAARDGVSLLGTDIYVTTFPCPPCAMLIAESGVRRLFFRDGYAMLDGNNILKSKNVTIIKVDYPSEPVILNAPNVIPYPEK